MIKDVKGDTEIQGRIHLRGMRSAGELQLSVTPVAACGGYRARAAGMAQLLRVLAALLEKLETKWQLTTVFTSSSMRSNSLF